MGNFIDSSIDSSKNYTDPHVDAEIEAIKSKLLKYEFYSLLSSLQDTISHGAVILPQDKINYIDARRRAFNLDQRGFPLLIVQPRSTDDVVKSINFYRNHVFALNPEVTLCISCGGHSSQCMMSGSFVIDMKYMNTVSVDVENNTISCGGGAYVKELDRALAQYHLAVPTGTYPLVGIGGLSLRGGYGWLSRKYGLTVDHIVEVEVVTAEGEIVVANESNTHKDLLWACRGGGGNFGVVTKFVFRCVKLPSRIFGGMLAFYPSTTDTALSLVQNYDDLVQDMEFDMSSCLALLGGKSVIGTVWVYAGEATSVDEISTLTKAKNLGGWLSVTLENSIKERPYHHDIQTMLLPFQTSGHIYVTILPIGTTNEPIPLEIWNNLLTFTRAPLNSYLAKAQVAFIALGGATETADHDYTLTCLSEHARHARYVSIIEVHWRPEYGQHGKDLAIEWARTVVFLLTPCKTKGRTYAPDVIQHRLDEDLGISVETHDRLRIIKSRYDRNNIFCNNVNILPADP